MRDRTATAALVVALACAWASGCGESGRRQETRVSKDIEQLSKLVNLAERPSDAVWETHEFGRGGIGPSDWAVIAVLEYPRETLEAILAKSPASQNAQAVLPKNAGWLPKEARDIVAPDGRVNGSIRSAQLFERSPLTHGYLVPIPGTQKLLLYLQTS